MHSVIHGLIKESCENIHYSPCPKMLAQAAKRELKKNAIFSKKNSYVIEFCILLCVY